MNQLTRFVNYLQSNEKLNSRNVALSAGLIAAGVGVWYLRSRNRPPSIQHVVFDQDENQEIEKFVIKIPDQVLDDLQRRLRNRRFPDQVQNAQWDYGTSLEYMNELVQYWEENYDWRKWEAKLNEFPQFTTNIGNLKIHFIHVKCKTTPKLNHPAILLIHGWPSSFFEFSKVIDQLTDPEAYGRSPEDGWDVVVPSLPGYGFSSAPKESGYDIKAVAVAFVNLMRRLGYSQYVAQGGDWGSLVSSYMALLDPHNCRGIHLNMLLVYPQKGLWGSIKTLLQVTLLRPLYFTTKEWDSLQRLRDFGKRETGYADLQTTKPQTPGFALADSPVGLAAWLVEKYHTWSDSQGNVERRFTKDELLTHVMIYWVTNTITSSMRLYYETRRTKRWGEVESYVNVPTAFAFFPGEIVASPRVWAKRKYNIVRWTEMASGGHFAAFEEPELFVNELSAFVKSITQ